MLKVTSLSLATAYPIIALIDYVAERPHDSSWGYQIAPIPHNILRREAVLLLQLLLSLENSTALDPTVNTHKISVLIIVFVHL